MKYYAVINASSKNDYIINEYPFEAETNAEALERAREIWLEKSSKQKELARENPESYGGIYLHLLGVKKVVGHETKEITHPI